MRVVLLFAFLISGLYSLSQNTSPYWSLAGNNNATTASKLGTTNAINLAFFTNNVERMRINTSGLIGIGTTAPLSKFHVNGSSSFGANVTSTNATRVMNLIDGNAVMRIMRIHTSFAPAIELLSRTSSNGTNVSYWDMYTQPTDASFRIRDRLGGDNDRLVITHTTGFVGIGTTTPTQKFHVVSQYTAVYGQSTGTSGYGVYGTSGYIGVAGNGSSYGVYGTGGTYGVYGSSGAYGVYGSGSYGLNGQGSTLGVYGSGTSYGLYGSSSNGKGVFGTSSTSEGVYGFSTNKQGGWFQSQNSQGLWAKTVAGDYAGVFEGNVWTYGTYSSSDENLKKEIKDFSGAMDIINQLKPKNYSFRRDGKYASMNLPKGNHIGLIAQELEKVLPDLVKESTHDIFDKVPGPVKLPAPGEKIVEENNGKETIKIKSINYTELIPILVRGIQELDSANKAKDEIVARLEEEILELKEAIGRLDGSFDGGSSIAWMKQNMPNPVRVSTNIQYFIPDNTRAARILVTNAKGQQLRVYNVSGKGVVSFAVGTLPSGTYTYSLVADGKTISSKKMVIVK